MIMNEVAEAIKLNKRTIRASLHDMVKSAKAVDLVYVLDDDPGYVRQRVGKHFCYFYGSVKIKDKIELERIKKLGIPPACIMSGFASLPMVICRQRDLIY